MKLMIDLNILIDIFQERVPHYENSSQVLTKVLNEEITGVMAGHTLTTLYYLLSRFLGNQKALEIVDWVLVHFEIDSADKKGFLRARTFDMTDFEDAVVACCAKNADCDYIITRNKSDFKRSPIPTLTPQEFLEMS